MLRLIVPAIVSLAALSMGSSDAEACGDIGCHAMVVLGGQSNTSAEQAEPETAFERRIAPAANEAEVRAREEAKLQPPTPEIWQHFKTYAYKQLPSHAEKRFTAVWIGMTVETADETIPAVGLQGIWW